VKNRKVTDFFTHTCGCRQPADYQRGVGWAVPMYDAGPVNDLRARYVILGLDDSGVADVDFRKVSYDREAEIALAHDAGLPYLDLYKESLLTGRTHQHDHDLLQDINAKYDYTNQAASFLARS